MGFELELRREAIRYTRDRGMSIQEALWAVYRNAHHRLENFSNFLRLSGAPQSADKDKAMQSLQKKVADLERQIRLQTWRDKFARGRLAAANSNWLSLLHRLLLLSLPWYPCLLPKQKGKAEAKGKKKANLQVRLRSKRCSPSSSSWRYPKSLDPCIQMPEGARGICVAFPEKDVPRRRLQPSPHLCWLRQICPL